ncbi:MAG: hypothetical protein KIS95_13460 [Anaerolineae bacterium]|uniref:hypothetical protein n=1 Tax=Promineifilum sp. TaxID=2664178 RepID=UPI001DCB849D|nr:hypothetical protein [Anaerolineales bacterium]MCB8934448.1 hypothetical protein [Promineifilum sp.]MCO5182303.1 hypothetical protein [Promineifilum sp.]MCW5848237.1 hypothetical protein [Anaerolineae bacterium]
MRRLLLLLPLLALFLAGCAPGGDEPALMGDEPVVMSFPSPDYGIHAFLWWKPDTALRDLGLINDMGFTWVKQKFPWREIEGIEKGQFDWYRTDYIVEQVEKAGLKLLVRLDRQPFWSEPLDNQWQDNGPPGDPADFGDFCGAVAGRYRGRIGAYQVWNEPNLDREWGLRPPDPAGYTELLKACYTAIKAADPAAIVISAGLAPTGTDSTEAMPDQKFLQGMYDAGAADYFDVLGVNAPGYKAPPELAPAEAEAEEYGGGRWFAFRHVEDSRALMVANGDGRKQVAILEMGWTLDEVNPEYAWHRVDEATQAAYLVRAYQYAAEHWQPWMGLMVTIYIADWEWTPDNEQWWWSIVLPDGTPRPAYEALKEMEKTSIER